MKENRRGVFLSLLVAVSCGVGAQDLVVPAGNEVLTDARTSSEGVLAWVVVGNLDKTLGQLMVLATGSPAKPAERNALLDHIGLGLGLQGATQAIDASRPIALAVLSPRGEAGDLQLLVAVPVRSGQAFLQLLNKALNRHPGGTQREAAYTAGQGLLVVGIFKDPDGTVAYMAFQSGASAHARHVLFPIRETPFEGLVARVLLEELPEALRAKLDQAATELATLLAFGQRSDPRATHGMRHLRRATQYVGSVSALDIRANASPEGVRLEFEARALPGSPLAENVAAQNPGPTWGAELMPEDALLVYATRMSPRRLQEDTEDLVMYLGALSPDTPEKRHSAWRSALGDWGRFLTGETVFATWPAEGGGIGVGGAFRASFPARSRNATTRAYLALGPSMGKLMAAELGLDPGKIHFRVRARENAGREGGTATDELELMPRWPASASREKKAFQWLYGDRIVLALATIGDQVVWAAGRDHRARLHTMVRAALGEKTPSMAGNPGFARARDQAPEGRVSLSYLSTAGVARLVGRVFQDTDSMTPERELMLAPFLRPSAKQDAIVSTTRVLRNDAGASYLLATLVPPPALAELGRMGGAMWRIGFSYLLGPPPLPPIPAPPASLIPPADLGPATPPMPPTGPGDVPTGRGT
ncbi:MAG: hypothetical protein HY698_21970 [Deltaproteobacteria bacterium]|nr:hypothetical protein [Deltaproteobacteria bacterium]